MPCVKIKQLDERVATAGVHLGGGPERRKLEPGEIVDIPEDLLLPDGTTLFDTVWATGKVEMVPDPPTRPLDYGNYREGKLCSPGFKPRDVSEEREMHRARDKAESRIETEDADPPAGLDEPPARKPKAKAKPRAKVRRPVNKRMQRRASMQAAQHGEEATT